MLEFCEDVLCHPVLLKLVLNGCHDIVYHRAVYSRLIEKVLPDRATARR
jgi:hypothetical protein